MAVHDHDDAAGRSAAVPGVLRLPGHLVWQWWAPELWRRFTIALRRQLARHLGLSETACRQLVRVQFAKVAEFQRRGVIHFHALIRLDGQPTDLDAYPPPAVQVDSATLADLVRAAAAQVAYAAPAGRRQRPGRGGCGSALRSTPDRSRRTPTGRPHGAELHPETVAAYVAKYATKAAADLPDRPRRRQRASAPAAGHAAAPGRPRPRSPP